MGVRAALVASSWIAPYTQKQVEPPHFPVCFALINQPTRLFLY